MAGRSASPDRRGLTRLTGAVLVGHLLALAGLARQWDGPEVLRPLATPMLTREIRPDVTPAMPISKPKPPVVSTGSVFSATKKEASANVPQPKASAPAPEPEATPSAETTPVPAEAVATPAPVLPPPTVASAPAPSDDADLASWPGDTRLSYRVTGYFRGDLHGDGQVTWQRDKRRYQVRVDIGIGLLASFTMTSQGVVGTGGLLPQAYEESVKGRKRRTVQIQNDQLIFDGGLTEARPPGVQDTASQFVELSHRFATGQVPLAVGQTLEMWLARPGGADRWTYDVVAQETLYPASLPPVQAFHLKPRPLAKPRGPITAELWFAPSLQYLPVRIRMNVGNDSWLDLLVDKIEQR